MEKDFFNSAPFFTDYGVPPPNASQMDINQMNKDPFFNPIIQYEQAYYYYRYLCTQMDYKIKCKEYEKMCTSSNSGYERKERKIE